jgi:dihydroorotate dehydrogenase (NAD+) catalytic subunit
MNVVIAPRTGLQLRNPVMTASGTFGYGVEFASHMDISGLGAVICKGTTQEARSGNPPIRMTETAAGMLNAIGLQNVGVEAVIRDKAPQWVRLPIPIIVNVSGSSVEEYRSIIERLHDVPGIAGIELNISCPNVRQGGAQFGTDPAMAAEVTRAARVATSLPLLVKLSPNVADIRTIAVAVEAAGADALTVANTVYGLAIDPRTMRPVLANVTGGLSGPAIKPYALYLVYQVAQAVTVPVIGVGGIMNGRDAAEYMLAGATAIQLGTALLLDPTSWRRVIQELDDWCRVQGVSALSEIVGAANSGFKKGAGETSLAGSL